MNISTDLLQAFVKVAERLSVSGAAQDLGVSKGLISKRLAHLESEINVTLVVRNSRKLALTPAGQLYLDHARQALTTLQDANEVLRSLKSETSGQIRITAPVSWGSRTLSRAIPEFLALYPEIEIELVLQDRLLDITKEQIDIALRMTAIPGQDFVSIPIAKLDWVICVSPAYQATAGEPLHPDDLTRHPCMSYWSTVTDEVWHLRRDSEESFVKLKSRYRANNPEAIVEAALAGLGVALLPKYCCEEQLLQGRLVALLEDWTPVTKFGNLITAVIAPDRVRFSRNQAFLGFLKQRFGQIDNETAASKNTADLTLLG
jgi:DNA-binding transcriptional LysR family regulator